ncbi:Aldo/keto reductase family-domain-containing protein [Bombardia bombarda]|uniref:Aldo/keto reductase family-domain-containing protein n=1 Tax=Bombardia bombarda TaxID=252184 RepID=A0AA39X7Z7_9PEZI|nr:Aldo/keto reductase family-domain-containing protein [Bombardia bombarda]
MATSTTSPPPPHPPLSTLLPSLILGTATFNHQYVTDPLSMPYRDIVARAISLGVTAFDTSPYYGPSEILLGEALSALASPPSGLPRSSFTLITKAGRIVLDEFDYSPAYIRYSVLRSLRRLHTPYLDLVYTHDVEFVSPAETLAAVRELRRLRDEDGLIRYVGISGFPVDVLAERAEMILAETGEPLDAVLSYGHFTIQNRRLGAGWLDGDGAGAGAGAGVDERSSCPLARLKKAGVDVVLNASMLGMGLLTSRGIPADPVAVVSPLAKWHPSPPELRIACKKIAAITEAAAGERLESVAIRWALEEWARVGAAAGVGVPSSSDSQLKVGATVCGVSSIAELEETVAEWAGVLSGLEQLAGADKDNTTATGKYGSARQKKVVDLVQTQLWPALGSWLDYAWASPGDGFVNTRREEDRGAVPHDDGVMDAYEELKKNAREASVLR